MIIAILKNLKYLFCILIALAFMKAKAQDAQLKIADSLYAIGNFSEAIKSYKKVPTKDDYILLKIAQAHKAKGTYQDALNYYEKVILMNTKLLSAKLEYAKLLMSTNKFKKADSVYSGLVANYNDNPDFQYRLGLAKKKLKDSTAIIYFEEAFRLDSTHQKSCFEVAKHYLKKRKHIKVEDITNKGLASYPENPELINVIAQNYLLRKYYSEAIPYFEKLIELNHNNEFVHASLALCYHKDYEYKKAIEQYLQALTFNNQVPLRYTRLAQAYTSIKKYDEALISYKMALELKDLPIDKDLYNIAMTYRHKEEWENAIKHMKLSIKENPNYHNAQYQLATFADAYYKDPKVKLKYYTDCLKKLEASKEDNTFINFLKQTTNKRIRQLEQEIEKTKNNIEKK